MGTLNIGMVPPYSDSGTAWHREALSRNGESASEDQLSTIGSARVSLSRPPSVNRAKIRQSTQLRARHKANA